MKAFKKITIILKSRIEILFFRFTLGSHAVADHYFKQFKEIFTKEGRQNVHIKHIVPGQAPCIAYTSTLQRAHQQVLLYL